MTIKNFMREKNVDIFTKIKYISIGIIVMFSVFVAVFMKNHYRALMTAIQYPDVVETLKISKKYEVKK